MRTRPCTAADVQPTLRTVSSIPGMDWAALERTDTSNGRRRSPNRLVVACSRKLTPSVRPSISICLASASLRTIASQSSIGKTKAGGTGSPSAAIRARFAAFAPMVSAECCLVNSPSMRTICIAIRLLSSRDQRARAREADTRSRRAGRLPVQGYVPNQERTAPSSGRIHLA